MDFTINYPSLNAAIAAHLGESPLSEDPEMYGSKRAVIKGWMSPNGVAHLFDPHEEHADNIHPDLEGKVKSSTGDFHQMGTALAGSMAHGYARFGSFYGDPFIHYDHRSKDGIKSAQHALRYLAPTVGSSINITTLPWGKRFNKNAHEKYFESPSKAAAFLRSQSESIEASDLPLGFIHDESLTDSSLDVESLNEINWSALLARANQPKKTNKTDILTYKHPVTGVIHDFDVGSPKSPDKFMNHSKLWMDHNHEGMGDWIKQGSPNVEQVARRFDQVPRERFSVNHDNKTISSWFRTTPTTLPQLQHVIKKYNLQGYKMPKAKGTMSDFAAESETPLRDLMNEVDSHLDEARPGGGGKHWLHKEYPKLHAVLDAVGFEPDFSYHNTSTERGTEYIPKGSKPIGDAGHKFVISKEDGWEPHWEHWHDGECLGSEVDDHGDMHPHYEGLPVHDQVMHYLKQYKGKAILPGPKESIMNEAAKPYKMKDFKLHLHYLRTPEGSRDAKNDETFLRTQGYKISRGVGSSPELLKGGAGIKERPTHVLSVSKDGNAFDLPHKHLKQLKHVDDDASWVRDTSESIGDDIDVLIEDYSSTGALRLTGHAQAPETALLNDLALAGSSDPIVESPEGVSAAAGRFGRQSLPGLLESDPWVVNRRTRTDIPSANLTPQQWDDITTKSSVQSLGRIMHVYPTWKHYVMMWQGHEKSHGPAPDSFWDKSKEAWNMVANQRHKDPTNMKRRESVEFDECGDVPKKKKKAHVAELLAACDAHLGEGAAWEPSDSTGYGDASTPGHKYRADTEQDLQLHDAGFTLAGRKGGTLHYNHPHGHTAWTRPGGSWEISPKRGSSMGSMTGHDLSHSLEGLHNNLGFRIQTPESIEVAGEGGQPPSRTCPACHESDLPCSSCHGSGIHGQSEDPMHAGWNRGGHIMPESLDEGPFNVSASVAKMRAKRTMPGAYNQVMRDHGFSQFGDGQWTHRKIGSVYTTPGGGWEHNEQPSIGGGNYKGNDAIDLHQHLMTYHKYQPIESLDEMEVPPEFFMGTDSPQLPIIARVTQRWKHIGPSVLRALDAIKDTVTADEAATILHRFDFKVGESVEESLDERRVTCAKCSGLGQVGGTRCDLCGGKGKLTVRRAGDALRSQFYLRGRHSESVEGVLESIDEILGLGVGELAAIGAVAAAPWLIHKASKSAAAAGKTLGAGVKKVKDVVGAHVMTPTKMKDAGQKFLNARKDPVESLIDSFKETGLVVIQESSIIETTYDDNHSNHPSKSAVSAHRAAVRDGWSYSHSSKNSVSASHETHHYTHPTKGHRVVSGTKNESEEFLGDLKNAGFKKKGSKYTHPAYLDKIHRKTESYSGTPVTGYHEVQVDTTAQDLHYKLGQLMPELHGLVTSSSGEERRALGMLFAELVQAQADLGNFISTHNQTSDESLAILASHYSTVYREMLSALDPYRTSNPSVTPYGPYQLKGVGLTDSVVETRPGLGPHAWGGSGGYDHYDYSAGKPISHPLVRKDGQGRHFFYDGIGSDNRPLYIHHDGQQLHKRYGSFGHEVPARDEAHQHQLMKLCGAHLPGFFESSEGKKRLPFVGESCVCPKCGSKNTVLMPTDYETEKCKDCGHIIKEDIMEGAFVFNILKNMAVNAAVGAATKRIAGGPGAGPTMPDAFKNLIAYEPSADHEKVPHLLKLANLALDQQGRPEGRVAYERGQAIGKKHGIDFRDLYMNPHKYGPEALERKRKVDYAKTAGNVVNAAAEKGKKIGIAPVSTSTWGDAMKAFKQGRGESAEAPVAELIEELETFA